MNRCLFPGSQKGGPAPYATFPGVVGGGRGWGGGLSTVSKAEINKKDSNIAPNTKVQ